MTDLALVVLIAALIGLALAIGGDRALEPVNPSPCTERYAPPPPTCPIPTPTTKER